MFISISNKVFKCKEYDIILKTNVRIAQFYIHNSSILPVLIGGKSIKDELKLADLDLPEENKLYFKDLGMTI